MFQHQINHNLIDYLVFKNADSAGNLCIALCEQIYSTSECSKDYLLSCRLESTRPNKRVVSPWARDFLKEVVGLYFPEKPYSNAVWESCVRKFDNRQRSRRISAKNKARSTREAFEKLCEPIIELPSNNYNYML